jgi:hypothetical protein
MQPEHDGYASYGINPGLGGIKVKDPNITLNAYFALQTAKTNVT